MADRYAQWPLCVKGLVEADNRIAAFWYKETAEVTAAGNAHDIVQLPAGQLILLLPQCRIAVSAAPSGGTASTARIAIGWKQFEPIAGLPTKDLFSDLPLNAGAYTINGAADDDGLMAAFLPSTAGHSFLTVGKPPIRYFHSKKGITLTYKVTAAPASNTISANTEIFGHVSFLRF